MKKQIYGISSYHVGYGRYVTFMFLLPMIHGPKNLKAAKTKRAVAALHMEKLVAIAKFLEKMNYIRAQMLLNATTFVTPPIPVTDTGAFATHIGDLVTAENYALTRADGGVSARNVVQELVLTDVHSLQGYVQGLADALHNTQKAVALIQLSGFDVSLREPGEKGDFTAKYTGNSGEIKLAVNVKKATGGQKSYSFKWQSSLDEKQWADIRSTQQGKTLVIDLTPGTYMWFRFLVVLNSGEQEWSQPLKIMIV